MSRALDANDDRDVMMAVMTTKNDRGFSDDRGDDDDDDDDDP